MSRTIAVPVLPQVAPFELGVLCEVFGTDRTEQGIPRYDFWVCGVEPGKALPTRAGFEIVPAHPLDRLDDAAIVAVPASPPNRDYPEPLLAALRRAHDRGALVLSVCSGAFVLGAAGLLDGRRCTTHWMYADELQQRHPTASVDPDVLYVCDGSVWTSAGTAAGIDLCLHLMREREGSAVVQAIARRMVVPPHRAGGQKQYVDMPLPTWRTPTLEPILTWMMAHLDEAMTVATLAVQANMAPRTFARRFRAETGSTPHDWLTAQRILLARRLLEETDLTVDTIAERAGFGNAAALRHHFTGRLGTPPHAYRTTFRIQREPA